jgi:hypothetical protein
MPEQSPSASAAPEISGTSVVLIGSFNPAIIQPAWLASKGLIGESEADAANIDVITHDISAFSTDWLRVLVTGDRFLCASEVAPSFDLLRDLTVGIFRHLAETPITAMGINRSFHFPAPSEEAWHAFGHKLAPKDIWNDVMSNPGTRAVVIQGARPDKAVGHVFATVEPSIRVQPGIYININDHYQLDQMGSSNASAMADVLITNWEPSFGRAQTIVDRLLSEL